MATILITLLDSESTPSSGSITFTGLDFEGRARGLIAVAAKLPGAGISFSGDGWRQLLYKPGTGLQSPALGLLLLVKDAPGDSETVTAHVGSPVAVVGLAYAIGAAADAAGVAGTGSDPNPPSLSFPAEALAGAFAASRGALPSAQPSGYSAMDTVEETGEISLAACFLELTSGSSEDPGVFTAGSAAHVAATAILSL